MAVTPLEPSWAFDGQRYRRYQFSQKITTRIKILNRLDNWHAPINYAGDLALIAGAIALPYAFTWWLYPITLIVIASRQRAFSNLLHESAHGIAANSKVINLLLGTVFTAYPIFQTHYGYKRSHVATHHPKLGDPDRDPDLKYFIEQGVYATSTRRELTLRLLVYPALGSKAVSHLYFLARDRILRRGSTAHDEDHRDNRYWRTRMRRDKVAFTTSWILAALGIICSGIGFEFVLFWLVPYLTAFQVIGWYIELSEHTPIVKFSNTDLYMTRNRLSRGLERFLTGTYADHHHLDHHLDTRTPYWNLKRAHRIRMEDAEYARLHATFGGLFTRGPHGQASALSSIVDQLAPRSSQTTTLSR